MKDKNSFLLLSFLGLALLSPLARANASDNTRLKLPWAQIQKLLNINKDEIRLTWGEFQTLLRHTRQKRVPALTISDGDVVLSKEEFKVIINSLILPPPPLSQSYLTKAEYAGVVKKDSVAFKTTIHLHLHNKKGKLLELNIFPGSVGFEEVLFDGQPANTEHRGGRLYLSTKADGYHKVQLQFSISNPRGLDSQQFGFPIVKTPITKFDLVIPESHLDVKIPNALSLETKKGPKGTRVEAILAPNTYVHVSWNPIVPSKDKGPAQIYVDANHLLSIEDDALRVQSVLNFQILKNSIDAVRLEIPRGYDVVHVTGDSLGEWEEIEGKQTILQIPFTYARKGRFTLTIITEHIPSEKKETFRFSGLTVKGATREKGFVGIELKTSAEVTEPKRTQLERIDLKELPRGLISQSQRPLLYAYKFLRPPFGLEFEVEQHEDVHVLSSVIDTADSVSWQLEEGKLIHQITYSLRNTWKQFLEVELPKGGELWSVFVDGKPAKPSENENGKLLIPLTRSKQDQSGLRPIRVELIYFEKSQKQWFAGRQTMKLPATDMIVSRLNWSVYMPSNYKYAYFGVCSTQLLLR